MKVSLNTVRRYLDFELPSTPELVARINSQLGTIESVVELGERYAGATIVSIVTAVQHPDADRLRVCTIDDNGAMADVECDENGYVHVVCGAPNARAGILAVWLPPGSVVPASFDDEPFTLGSRKLRGVMSHGMLAAADELALGSDHEGILEIHEDDLPRRDANIALIGSSFPSIFGLDDTIIDIENKMFTHRPDLFGQIGIAREIAGIFNKPFSDADWYWKRPPLASAKNELELEVFNDAPAIVPRLMTATVKNVTVEPSPLWLRIELVRLGSKAINSIVDITNYAMLLTGQPTHAYDYDKIRGKRLGARLARSGEMVTLLNGKQYALDSSDIVIADGEGVIGLAGIMGGSTSEVSTATTNIVLEVATFDMYSVRKSSMRHGLFTDALTRFNKGQSPLQNDRVLMYLLELLNVTGNAGVSDIRGDDGIYRAQSMAEDIRVDAGFINSRLGLNLNARTMSRLLQNVHFACYTTVGSELSVTPPLWRTDVLIAEDIVEEVGRLYGYDALPRELPRHSIVPAASNRYRTLASALRAQMKRVGANEVLTYSFVSQRLLEKAGQDPSRGFTIANALSPALQKYRLSVLPSLLDKVHMNIKAGYDQFNLFEIGKGRDTSHIGNDGLPAATRSLEFVYASKKALDGAPYYHAAATARQLLAALSYSVDVRPLDEASERYAMFAHARTAELYDTITGRHVGVVGEFTQSVMKNFKLPRYSSGAVIDIDALLTINTTASRYTPIARFPSSSQDISLIVDTAVPYAAIYSVAVEAAVRDRIDIAVTPVSIYKADDTAERKTVTVRLRATHADRTLTTDDMRMLVEQIVTRAHDQLDAAVA